MAKMEDIEALILNSGNSFHAKVARWFSENRWHVTVSPYYMDQSQSKAREIDLIVERLIPIENHRGESSADLLVRLYVECKYIASPSVLWFANKDLASATDLVCSAGVFTPENSYTKKHHYISSGQRVAKLFASVKDKGSENEPFYKALNQVLNGLVAMRGRGNWSSHVKKQSQYVHEVLEFPVVVCSSFDQVYAVPFEKDGAPEKVGENFQLEVRYAYIDSASHNRNEYFLLDIVEFAQLGKLVSLLEGDARAAIALLPDD